MLSKFGGYGNKNEKKKMKKNEKWNFRAIGVIITAYI